jgi:hypothetical protein
MRCPAHELGGGRHQYEKQRNEFIWGMRPLLGRE